MIIRNEHTGAEYISDSLRKAECGYFIDDETIYTRGCEEYQTIFDSNDGWEEVKEEPKWHDIRKNPNDLPPKATEYSWNSKEVLICLYDKAHDIKVIRSAYYDYHLKKWVICVYDMPIKKGVIAWREMPKFMEE